MVPDRYLQIIISLTKGTPLHNSLKDMFSLFRFLEYPHFNVYSQFNKHFQAEGAREGALRMQILLRGTMLRRKKDDKVNGRPLIVLPEKVIPVKFKVNELDDEGDLC